ncbi:hypothetical protein LguiB_026829 [Lonicera macranthoides]
MFELSTRADGNVKPELSKEPVPNAIHLAELETERIWRWWSEMLSLVMVVRCPAALLWATSRDRRRREVVRCDVGGGGNGGYEEKQICEPTLLQCYTVQAPRVELSGYVGHHATCHGRKPPHGPGSRSPHRRRIQRPFISMSSPGKMTTNTIDQRESSRSITTERNLLQIVTREVKRNISKLVKIKTKILCLCVMRERISVYDLAYWHRDDHLLSHLQFALSINSKAYVFFQG